MNDGTSISAFPWEQGHTPEGTWNQSFECGMTLRDYFAAKALQGMLACDATRRTYIGNAEEAYKWADAMLLARQEVKS